MAKFLKRVARVEPSVRLPTEAEWGYACRAGSEGRFGGTGALRDMAWSAESRTHVGGGKMPNAWGICDMHGNVAEWCGGIYVDHSSDAAVDPKCTSGGTLRVCRGGCFNEGFPEKACRSAARARVLPRQKLATVGFRIVCTSRPASAEDLKCRPNSEVYLDDEIKRSENKYGQQSSGIVKTKTITLPGGATLELVWCPPGSFTMGSSSSEEGHDDSCGRKERPILW